MFARYLDYLIRGTYIDDKNNDETRMMILNAFKNVATTIDTRLLLQVRNHFIDRMANAPEFYLDDMDEVERYFINKNGKVYVKTDHIPIIPKDFLDMIITTIDNAIKAQYATRSIIGPVYIDKSVDGLLVPWNQRNDSTKSKCVVKMPDSAFSAGCWTGQKSSIS